MAARIVPTFLLKYVNHNLLLEKYREGYFNRPIQEKAEVTVVESKPILAPVYGTSSYDEIFSIKDRNNNNIVIPTTNHRNFCEFISLTENAPKGGVCKLCREEFDHEQIGRPIASNEKLVLTSRNAKGEAEWVYRFIYTFWTVECYCSIECMYTYIKRMLARSANERDRSFVDSEVMANMMYQLMYPGAGPLRPAQDTELLKVHGGSLSKEDWKNSKHIYIKTNRMLIIPAKEEYIRNSFGEQLSASDIIREINS